MVSSHQRDCDEVEFNFKNHNDTIEELTLNLQENIALIESKRRNLHNSPAQKEPPNEAEMEALLSEIKVLKSKSAMRRCDEKRKTSEEIVHLYEENCKLSATIEALKRSLDKRRIQNVSLKEENERYKSEKKRLYTLLKTQATEKDSFNGNLPSNKIAIVNKITILQKQNIELLIRYHEALEMLQVERENYAKFLKFIFLKILVFKCFVFSKNQIINNEFTKLENNCKTENLIMEPDNCIFVKLCKNRLKEDFITSGNGVNTVIKNFLCSHENKSLLATRDASVLCKLETLKNNENQADFEVSSENYNSAPNLQKVIVLIRLYKEKFHNEAKDKCNSKAKIQPSLKLMKVDKNLKPSSYPTVLKPKFKNFSYLKRKNLVSNKNPVSNIMPKRNENCQNTKILEIENSELGLNLKLEVTEKSLVNLENRILGKRENQKCYLELFTLGKDIFWNKMIFTIQLDEIFSMKFQDPLIMNNLGKNFWKFDIDPVFDIIENKDCHSKKEVKFEKELPSEGDAKLEDNDIKEDTKMVEDPKIQSENPKIETFIESKSPMSKSLSAYPIPFSYFAQEPKQRRLMKNRNKVPKIGKLNPSIEKKHFNVKEKDLQIKKEEINIQRPGLKIKIQDTKAASDVAPKNVKELKTKLKQKRISRSLSADRLRFTSTLQKIKEATGKEESVQVIDLDSKTQENRNSTIEDKDILIQELQMKIEELKSKIKAEDVNTEETNPKFQEKDIKLEETDLTIKEQYVKNQEPDIKIQVQDTKTQETDSTVQETVFNIPGQDIKIEKLHPQNREFYSKSEEDFRIQEQNLKCADSALKIENEVVSKNPDNSVQDIIIEKEIEEKLKTILEQKRTTRLSSADKAPYFPFTKAEKTNLEDNKNDSKIEYINSKKSEEPIKVIKKEKEIEREFKVILKERKTERSLSVIESEDSLISQKSFKEGNLIPMREIKKEGKKSQKNLVTQKKISQTKTIQSSHKVIKKKKLKSSKRTQTSEMKLEKAKLSRTLQSSSKSLHKKSSNSLHKKTLTKTVDNFPTLEFKIRPKSKGKSKPKVENLIKEKKKESREKIKSKDNDSLKSIPIRIENEGKSKSPNITSLFSPQPISRTSQSNEGKEENQSKNKNRFKNKKGSKESGRIANKIRNCEEGSNIESSCKGEEFIRGIQPFRFELSKRVSDCEDFSARKCRRMKFMIVTCTL